MRFACFVVALIALFFGIYTACRTSRVRKWPRIRANVVHWYQAYPLGEPVPPVVVHERLVIRNDGTEEPVGYSRTSSAVTYFAELVYFVADGVYAADLAFDQPIVDSVELLIDPKNPHHYDFPAPDYRSSLLLGAVGLLFLLAAVA